MHFFSRGQKIKLADITPQTKLQARLEMNAKTLNFDLSCFGLDENSQLSDDRYFVFFNQKESPQNEVVLTSRSPRAAHFEIDLARLPPAVRRLTFVATVDGAGQMSDLGSGRFILSANGQDVGEFAFRGADFSTEKAVMVSEIYFKEGWRVAANGQGFKDGLNAVLEHFGGQEIEENAPVAPMPQAEVKPQPVVKATPPPLPDAARVEAARREAARREALESNVPKTVSLKKADSSFKIDLSKSAGEIIATAQWIDNGDRSSNNDDLDLRAGILFPNGTMSMVTCTAPGSLQKKPYVFHLGDVKVASLKNPGRETIKVNSQISQNQGGKIAIVFSIYSAIANGPVAIASLKPIIELQHGNQTVKCELDFAANREAKKKYVYTYVIGLAIIDASQIEITPGGQVSPPISEATPWLEWNGSGGVDLSWTGPAVIKSGGKFLTGLLNAGNAKRYV